MFDIIKQHINLVEHLEKDLGVSFRQSGDNWKIEDRDQEACPFCNHHDCFSVKHDGDNSKAFYKCFSCGEYGDVITWHAKRNNLVQQGDEKKPDLGTAARELAKQYDLQLPNNFNPVQQVFSLAATYYHNCLIEVCDKEMPLLGGLTPLQYQLEIRRRKRPILEQFKVGFSDGGLTDYLEGIGIDPEVLLESGLVKRSRGPNGALYDFLPKNTFIYPHFVKGRASHFTFKDPLKKLAYQLPKKCSLNGHMFYGQDTFNSAEVVALCEGENDFLALYETGLCPATLCLIGQISKEQLEWLRENCSSKKIITFFDPDDAGDKYRIKIEMMRKSFKGLAHVYPPEDKDIDELIVNGANLNEICSKHIVKVNLPSTEKPVVNVPWEEPTSGTDQHVLEEEEKEIVSDDMQAPVPVHAEVSGIENSTDTENLPVSVAEEVIKPLTSYVPPNIPGTFNRPGSVATPDRSNSLPVSEEECAVVQQKGRYARVKWKDGELVYTPISDFTIELLNIYEKEDGDREREVYLQKVDGTKSRPFMVSSEVKVTLKAFKVLMARIADAEWTGREADLDAMWKLVFSKASDSVIQVPRRVGWHSVHNCWIFRNVMITGSGVAVTPDENGVFWANGRSSGIKPSAINVAENGMDSSIPSLETSLSREESDVLLGEVVKQLGRNLNSTGQALLMLGWVWSNVYSDLIFRENLGMSILLLWSTNGGGKTTLVNWMRSFFGFMENTGRTSVQRLHSGIGFQRQGEYYSSIPMFLDELRRDEKSLSALGMIRSWYDRDGRTIATREGGGIITQTIRSTLIVAGEDLPGDPATRERCVSIRIAKDSDREKVETFAWFQKYCTQFSAITYRWILDSCLQEPSELLKGMEEVEKTLKKAGCTSRVSKNWAAAGYLGNELAKMYCPDFDFLAFLVEATTDEQIDQVQDSNINSFWEVADILRSGEHPKVTDEMFLVDEREGLLHLWFPAIFKAIVDDSRGRYDWSKNSLLKAIKEEPYYVSDHLRVTLGLHTDTRRRVLTLDLKKAPDVLKSLARYEIKEEKK